MTIRGYKTEDKEKCLEIFKSNCPKYFDVSEETLFGRWLDHQGGDAGYQSPAYTNSEKDAYYVIEIPERGVIGCGGFYVLKDLKEARLAWGMVHASFHRKGFGSALYNFRRDVMKSGWPSYKITLGTSQHTYTFYRKMGMNVTAMMKAGYGADLDRYDMVEADYQAQ